MLNITKTLFNCKSKHHIKNGNYEFISYGEETNKHIYNDTEPISSTMIDYRSNIPKPNMYYECNNYAFETSCIENISHISQTNGDTLCNSAQETELTRRQLHNSNDSNQRTELDYESLTIVENNKSPLTTFRATNLDLSINSLSECLHSTKIETQCVLPEHKCSTFLSPNCSKLRSSLESSSSPSLTDSPVSSSSHIESEINHEQISVIDSIITNLSTTEEVESTRVCNNNYEATFVDDVSVHFADQVRILRDNNDEWLYVQVMGDGRQGYVPRTIVLDLNQFIQQLKLHKEQLTRSKVSLLDFPVRL